MLLAVDTFSYTHLVMLKQRVVIFENVQAGSKQSKFDGYITPMGS